MKRLILSAVLMVLLLTGCHGSRYINGAAAAYGQRYHYCQETPQQRLYQDQMLFYQAAQYQRLISNQNAVNLKHRY